MKYLLATSMLAAAANGYRVDSGLAPGGGFYRVVEDALAKSGVSETIINNLHNHGCWASRLVGRNMALWLNAPSPTVDDMDRAIRDWASARNCVRKVGGACSSGIPAQNYGNVEISNGADDCEDVADTCLNTLCLIDAKYANRVASLAGGTTWQAPTESACTTTNVQTPCNYCSGIAPDLTCGEMPAPRAECVAQEADIFLSIDGSGSVKLWRFNIMRDYLVQLLENLDIHPDRVRVAASQWAGPTRRVEWTFSGDKAQVISDMGQMQYLAEGCSTCTRTGLALQHAHDQIQATRRQGVPAIIITFTDGKAHDANVNERLGQDNVTPAMADISAAGYKAYAVGISSKTVMGQLTRFTTSDAKTWMIDESDSRLAFERIGEILDEVVVNLCTGSD